MQPCRLHEDQKINKDKKTNLGAIFLGIQKAILAAYKEAIPAIAAGEHQRFLLAPDTDRSYGISSYSSYFG